MKPIKARPYYASGGLSAAFRQFVLARGAEITACRYQCDGALP